ncbi:MFS transporter [Paraburkholderia oxyphila]|uniref:MFS transporter n=1 Tax=Paraburkholderia oxyphila TaxID=614212 RepID=UPI0005B99337|nr:MFS transporter [Paraburkholderia oxyphila]
MPENNDTRIVSHQIAASILIGGIALLISGVQPILFGAMVNEKRITLDTMGLLVMAEIVALGLGAGLAVKLSLEQFRRIVVTAGVLVVVCNLLTTLHVSLLLLFLIRICTGLAEGVLVWSTVCVIVRSKVPERNSGIFSVFQVLIQAAFASVLTGLVMPIYSWRGGFISLTAVVLVGVGLGGLLPKRLSPVSETLEGFFVWDIAKVLPLAIAFFQQAGLGAAWAYLEPLGQSAGMSDMQSEALISTVLCIEVLGGLLGTALVRRLAPVGGVLLAATATIVSALGMITVAKGAITEFSVFAMIFGFFWPFVMPYEMGLALRSDSSGKIATLLPAAQVLGVAFGPLVAALSIDGEHVRAAATVCLILTACSAIACIASTSIATPRPLQKAAE